MLKTIGQFFKKHPLRILLWISVATFSSFMTWIFLLAPETKALRAPLGCKIPLPQIPLEFIEPVPPKEYEVAEGKKDEKLEGKTEESNIPQWKKNAIAFQGDKHLPRFAIVLTGLGLSQERMIEAVKELPPYVTLSFSPYSYDLESWIEKAKEAKHEILIDLPVTQKEPYCNGGPLALDSTLLEAENEKRMEELFQKAEKSIGFFLQDLETDSDMGYSFKKLAEKMGFVLLKEAMPLGKENLIPEWIDGSNTQEQLLKKIQNCAERCAERKKHILIAEATPAVMKLISDWAKTLIDKPYILAPLTALLADE